MTTTLTLNVHGLYSLRESALFGFGYRDERSFDGVMRMAFCVDDDFEQTAAVAVRESDGHLTVEIDSTADPERVAAQVARVLSVDLDASEFLAAGKGDPVLGRLQAVAPGLRPVEFYSPYEAAAWSIISARRARGQGIALRRRLSEAHGDRFEVAGETLWAFPQPSRLAQVESVPGLPADRIPRLHAVAQAALAGRLSVTHLVGLGEEAARAELQTLPGIGPFYSDLVLMRACGLPDLLPLNEPITRGLITELYGFGAEPTAAELTALAEQWRPFRLWACVLIRAASSRLPGGSPTAVR